MWYCDFNFQLDSDHVRHVRKDFFLQCNNMVMHTGPMGNCGPVTSLRRHICGRSPVQLASLAATSYSI